MRIRGQDDDVLRLHAGVDEAGFTGEKENDSLLAQLRIDVRIMDNFASEEYPPVGELSAGLVRVFDGAFDAVAKAEFLREFDRHVTRRKHVVTGAQHINEVAGVVAVICSKKRPAALAVAAANSGGTGEAKV